MRYTHKLEKPDGNCNYFLIPGKEECDNAENKLGQLEDIEDELGIDLITFFKYLNAKEVFFTNDFNEIQRAVVRSIEKKGLVVFEEAFSWGECDFTLCFNDYGKTWALTKEELGIKKP